MLSPLPPECEQLLIVGYVLGDLSPGEAMLFAELAAENPALMQQVRELQQSLELGFFAPETSPPPALRDRILATYEQNKSADKMISTLENPTVSNRNSRSKLSWNKIIMAIATALVLALGFNNYRLWQSLKNASINEIDVVKSDKIIYSLQGSDSAATDATARLIVAPDRLQAFLEAKNLPPLPPGKVYVLWTVVGQDAPYTTDKKGAILTQIFQVDSQGAYSEKITVPQPYRMNKNGIKKIAITVESESVPQDHTGSILISADSPEV